MVILFRLFTIFSHPINTIRNFNKCKCYMAFKLFFPSLMPMIYAKRRGKNECKYTE